MPAAASIWCGSPAGWAFRTASDLSFVLSRDVVEQKKLSRAAMETLAIVAYHQPVTRAEIEEIRGVATSKGTLDLLLETGWVRLRGRRRAPGRPVTYGTTPDFLDHFGLDAIDDLPGLEELKGAGFLEGRVPSDLSVPDSRPTTIPFARTRIRSIRTISSSPSCWETATNDRTPSPPRGRDRFRLPRWGQRGTAGASIPAQLTFEDIVKTYGETTVLDDVSLIDRARRTGLPARPFRLRQNHSPAHRRRRRDAEFRPGPHRRSAGERA